MSVYQANGYELHYQDQGSGTPVVLIHGLCMDHSMFAEQAAALTAAGYRVITPDLRGHGQSESKAEDYSMEDQAEDLCQLLRHLGIEWAHIGGMSMGGMIADAPDHGPLGHPDRHRRRTRTPHAGGPV